MGKKKRIRAPGWLVWGAKPIGGVTQPGRQLGIGQKTKALAEKIARAFRKKGYIAHVQPMLRKPRGKR